MRLLAPMLLIAALASPTLAATGSTSLRVVSTAPTHVSSPTAFSAAGDHQSPLGVVAVRDGYLVAWAEFAFTPTSYLWRLRVSRVREDGSVGDAIGIKVADATGLHVTPGYPVAMFAEGDGARIYWASFASAGGFVVSTVSVSAEGQVSEIATVGAYPAGDPGGATLHGARMGGVTALQLGRYVMFVESERMVRLTDLGGWGEPESIVAASGRFVSTWVAAGRVLMLQSLSAEGDVIGEPGGRGIENGTYGASLATDGSRVLIASSSQRADRTALHITIRTFDPGNGSVTETGFIPFPGFLPVLLWTGSAYLAAFTDPYSPVSKSVLGNDISSAGVVSQGAPRILLENLRGRFYLALGASRLAIVDERGSCGRIYCYFQTYLSLLPRDASTPATASSLISVAARQQHYASVAASKSSWFAVWRESSAIVAAPLSREGRSAPIELGDGGGSIPAVASDGSRFLALWFEPDVAEPGMLRGRFFDAEGHDTGARVDLPVHGVNSELAVGASSTMFLTAWKAGSSIEARRIGSDGIVLDKQPALILGPKSEGGSNISIDFDGIDFVAVWSDIVTDSNPFSWVLRSARITPGGSVAPAGTIVEAAHPIGVRSLRCGGGHCLVVWMQNSYAGGPSGLRGKLLRAGDLADESGDFQIAPSYADSTSISWDGKAFFVTWGDPSGPDPSEIRVTTVRPGVPVLVSNQPSTLALVPYSTWEAPGIACLIGGDCVMVNASPVDDAEHGRSVSIFKTFLHETRLRGVLR